MTGALTDADYRELLALRTGLRRFLRQSEDWARETGLTPAQHQLLLAVRGHDHPLGPSINDIAAYLLLRHHSAVELVDRAVAAGLVERRADPTDARGVRLALTRRAAIAIEQLSTQHRDELTRLAEHFRPLLRDFDNGRTIRTTNVRVARVYDEPQGEADCVLVDRLWPRGLRRDEASFTWQKEVAPSTELRRWYGHDPERFTEFARRYVDELTSEHASDLAQLAARARQAPLVLLTATKDVAHSAAAVLADTVIEATT